MDQPVNSNDFVLAAACGSVDIVRHMLSSDAACLNSTDARGHTALVVAAAYGNVEVVRLLLEHTSDVNATVSRTRRTALHIAAANGFDQVVTLLRDAGANTSLRDMAGSTAKDYAEVSPQPTIGDIPQYSDRLVEADERLVDMRNRCIDALMSTN